MTDFRRFPSSETRQIIDYNRFMELTGEKVFICLDRGVMEIARYLLNTRGSWRSTYVKEYVGTVGYNMPTEEEFKNVLEAIAEGNSDMSSCDDIVNALSGIQDAIASLGSVSGGGCGCGSSGAGGSGAGANPWNPGGDPDAYPPGFSSKEEFDGHKCKAAAKVVRDYINDLQQISLISIAGATVTAMAGLILAVLVTPVPFDDILTIAGVLLFSVLAASELANLSSTLNDEYDALVCSLLAGEDATESHNSFLSEIQGIIAGMGLSAPEESALNTVAASMVTFDAINRLYEPGSQYEIEYTCDCGEGEISPWTVVYGTATNVSPDNPILGEGVYEPGYGCLLEARHFGVSFSQPASVNSFLVDGGVAPVCSGGPTYFYYSDDNFTTLISSTNSPPQTSPAVGIRSMYVVWQSTGSGDEVELTQEPYV